LDKWLHRNRSLAKPAIAAGTCVMVSPLLRKDFVTILTLLHYKHSRLPPDTPTPFHLRQRHSSDRITPTTNRSWNNIGVLTPQPIFTEIKTKSYR